MIRVSILLLTMFGMMSLGAVAAAETSSNTKSLGKFGYWQAYETQEGKDPVCYMALTAKPPVSKKEKVKRGDVTLMITHRPAESVFDVVSYAAGTKFKSGSDVKVQVEGKSFDLFTQGDTAWSRDAATDRALAAVLRGASGATFSGTTANGKPVADAISLKGAAEAYYAIGKACGLQVEKPKAAKPDKTATQVPSKPQKPTKPVVKAVKKK